MPCAMPTGSPHFCTTTSSGPIAARSRLLPFCGTHRGKPNVVDLIRRRIPAVLRTFSFVAEVILVDGDQVAMLSPGNRRGARLTIG